MESPIKWAIFVFLTGFIGLILYISEKDTHMEAMDEADPYSLPSGVSKDHQENESK